MFKFKKVDDLLAEVCYDEEVVSGYPVRTEPQAKFISDLIEQVGYGDSGFADELLGAVNDEFSVERSDLDEISVEEASWLIDQLKDQREDERYSR